MYDFDKIVDRRNTNSLKYDFAEAFGKPANILPLWIADMDFPVAEEINEGIKTAVEHGIYGYSDSRASYFEVLSQWMKEYHGWEVQSDWLVKTPGVVFALATAVRAFTKERDSVLIQTPVYTPFSKVVLNNNRNLVDSILVERNGRYVVDLEDFEQKIIDNQVKLFILCNPHNPVGRVWSREELTAISEICLKHNVLVVSDEIHHDFVYEGNVHTVFAALNERTKEITITCTAPSKTFNLAGLQASNIFIPNEELRKRFCAEMEKVGCEELNTLGIVACECAYRSGGQWLRELKQYLKGNLDYVRNFLAEHLPKIHMVEPEGTYLLWLDFRALGLDKAQLEDLLVNKARLWLNAGDMFGAAGEGFQRLNMACPRATLQEAMERLERACKEVGL